MYLSSIDISSATDVIFKDFLYKLSQYMKNCFDLYQAIENS